MEFVEADLLDEKSMIKACEGSEYIVHTASPVDMGATEEQLIKPAVDGTLAIMKAAELHGVKKVVMTSSISAIGIGHPEQTHFTEADWSNEEGCDAYSKSKLLAEKAAWDHVDKMAQDKRFELVCINPGYICGPNLIESYFQSGELVIKMMKGYVPFCPLIYMSCVDVRNVA